MKRLVIIGFITGALIWLLALPILVGLFLGDWVEEWTADWPEPDAVDFRSGWFRSELNWTSADGIDLALQARHVPPLRPGLVRIEGLVSTPMTPEPAQLNGHLGLTGAWHLQGRVTKVASPATPGLEAHAVHINLAQPSGQPLTLILRAEQLRNRAEPAAPDLRDLRLMARHRSDDHEAHHLGLDLELEADNLGPAGLTLSAGPADPQALADLIDGLSQWATAQPDSLAQRMGLLTVAGAWQQLAAAGLVVQLERLRLGENVRLSGRWATALPQPQLEGGGQTTELIDWHVGLATALAAQTPDQAELEARAWLMTLAQHGWIRLEEEHFRVQVPDRPNQP
ncbi:MAG: hypothetical protein EA419_07000 [Wenzhouxiangella sp.]|nr:MAG: hypothetical protein EA419_07000 [Wenzhouxiangella sp.]